MNTYIESVGFNKQLLYSSVYIRPNLLNRYSEWIFFCKIYPRIFKSVVTQTLANFLHLLLTSSRCHGNLRYVYAQLY